MLKLKWVDSKYESLLSSAKSECLKKCISFDMRNSTSIEESDRVFLSTHKNRLPLKADDKRIPKLGRNYLETDELTLEQHKFVNALFKGLFDSGFLTSIISETGEVIAEGKWYGFKRKAKQEPVKGAY